MPDIDAPKMVRIDFSVPGPLLEQMQELAKDEGWKPAELHRMLWVLGFAAYTEQSNKRLINDRLRANKAKDQLDTWAFEVVKIPRTGGHQELFENKTKMAN